VCRTSYPGTAIPSLVKSLCGLLIGKVQWFVSSLQLNKTRRTRGVAQFVLSLVSWLYSRMWFGISRCFYLVRAQFSDLQEKTSTHVIVFRSSWIQEIVWALSRIMALIFLKKMDIIAKNSIFIFQKQGMKSPICM
jgi:hypothetical protein